MVSENTKRGLTFLYGCCWLGYLVLLTYIVLFKGSWDETREFLEMISSGTVLERRRVYLRPFESTRMFLGLWEYPYARWNVLGNILLFFPFGALVRGVAKRKRGMLLTLGLGFAASLCFESIQFLHAIGELDVDDILLNVLGALAGYGISCGVCAAFRHRPGPSGR